MNCFRSKFSMADTPRRVVVLPAKRLGLLVLYAARAFTEGLHWGLAWAGAALAVAIFVLERSARDSFNCFHTRRANLLKGVA